MANKLPANIHRSPSTLEDIARICKDAQMMLSRVQGHMLAPERKKKPPVFTIGQMAALCGMDKPKLEYRLKKMGLQKEGSEGKVRSFSLAELHTAIRSVRPAFLRPQGKEAIVLSVANFKGGVGKTTTSMCMAQGLSLRGHKVLCLDLDPQASLTGLFGLISDTEVTDDMTALHTLLDNTKTARLADAVRSTYWEGVDLVAANTNLYNVEFVMPAHQMEDKSYQFWSVLDEGLKELRKIYDVIIIDTPPSLSFLTLNALVASNGILVPLPPNNLDFASSVQFWKLFTETTESLQAYGLKKQYDFLNILLSRVDANDSASSVVREWIQATYKDKVLPVEIPKTTVAVSASTEFGTVYDIAKYEGSMKTYRRAREAYDRVVDLLEESIIVSWRQQEADRAPQELVPSEQQAVAVH